MISVTILTKNSARTVKNTLESTRNFDEVLLLDSGSTDNTLEIAKSFPNVRISTYPTFLGFGPMHRLACERATHDWILSLDADEVLSGPLIQEIKNLLLDPQVVYRIERRNFLFGREIRSCSGWYPDYVVRLFHRKKTDFSDDAVHEQVLTKDMLIHTLQGKICHTPYLEIADFLTKMQVYSTLFAKTHPEKKSSLLLALLHSHWAFFKSYFLRLGFLSGRCGYIISRYIADCAYYKYLKLVYKN